MRLILNEEPMEEKYINAKVAALSWGISLPETIEIDGCVNI